MRQYNKDKPKKWGFKVFALCASKSGLILNFEMYQGKAAVERARPQPRRYSRSELLDSSIEDMDLSVVNNTFDPRYFDVLQTEQDEWSICAASVNADTVPPSQESECGALVLDNSNSDGSPCGMELPSELEFTDTSFVTTNQSQLMNSTVVEATTTTSSKTTSSITITKPASASFTSLVTRTLPLPSAVASSLPAEPSSLPDVASSLPAEPISPPADSSDSSSPCVT